MMVDQATTQLPSTTGQHRARWLAVLLLIGGVMLLCLTGAGYVVYHANRVLPGIQAAGVDLGGLTEAEALATLDRRLSAYTAAPLTLAAGDLTWQVPPAELGVSYQARTTINEAMAIGRRGTPGERLGAWWPTNRTRSTLQPAGQLDQVGMLRGLAPALEKLNLPPANATVVIQTESGLKVTPAHDGQTVDLAAITQALQDRAMRLSSEPVSLRLLPVAPAIREQQFTQVKEAADLLLRQPFQLEVTSADDRRLSPPTPRRWSIAPQELTTLLTLSGPEQRSLGLDEARLTAYLSRVESELAQPAIDAELLLESEGRVTLKPHTDGLALDTAATVREINRAIAEQRYRTQLTTRVVVPAVPTASLEPTYQAVTRLLDRSLKLSAPDSDRILMRKDLAGFLTVEPRPEQPIKVALVPDRAALSQYLNQMARQINREPRAPVFKYLGGKVVRTTEPIQGRRLEIEDGVEALAAALVNPTTSELTLPLKVTDAAYADLNPSDIIIRDVLASGATYYGFSLPERRHNVELATSRLNGILIPPGEMFSFNRSVGRVNIASGYKTGYGIVLTNGAVTTVPSVGGGICQVATTVFHAAFRSGMPIGERNWHFYWIPTYGQAPSGLTGLDATVDEDYGLDFTFRNTTGNWIAVESGYDGQNMRITLRGVNPGWEVRIGTPKISNVKPADPKPVERPDPSMAPGKRLQVESARDGMDVAIPRTVLRAGQVLDQRTFSSHYEPSQNVTLVNPAEVTKPAEEENTKPAEEGSTKPAEDGAQPPSGGGR